MQGGVVTVEAEGEFAIFSQDRVNRLASSRRRSSDPGTGCRARRRNGRRVRAHPMARQSLVPTRDPADYPFTHRLRTRFAETDAMGVIHHAAYLPYLEEAHVESVRAIGHPYDAVRSGAAGDAREFPVLEVSVQYRQPLRFDDEVDVSLRIGAVRGATFQIAYLLAVGDRKKQATAVTVHGCVDGSGRPSLAGVGGGVHRRPRRLTLSLVQPFASG